MCIGLFTDGDDHFQDVLVIEFSNVHDKNKNDEIHQSCALTFIFICH